MEFILGRCLFREKSPIRTSAYLGQGVYQKEFSRSLWQESNKEVILGWMCPQKEGG